MGSWKCKLVILISVISLVSLANTVNGRRVDICTVTENKRTGRYIIAKSDIKQLFVNTFKTRTQLQKETTVPVSPFTSLLSPRKIPITQLQSRYDRRVARWSAAFCPSGYRSDDSCCCPTCRYYTRYTKVNDRSGTEWFVVHFPDDGMYQWVEVGMCGSVSTPTCNTCIQEYNFQSVLVSFEDPASDATNLSISFVQAAFPTYCKCTCGISSSTGPPGDNGPHVIPGPSGPPGSPDTLDIQ